MPPRAGSLSAHDTHVTLKLQPKREREGAYEMVVVMACSAPSTQVRQLWTAPHCPTATPAAPPIAA